MKLRLFSVLPVFAVLILPSLLIACWYDLLKHIHSYILINEYNGISEVSMEMEKMSAFVGPINASTIKFAKILSSSLNGTQVSFSEVKYKIAPLLFEGFSIIPYLTQISYIGIDGLFFSYYTDKNQTFAMYSNSPSTANSHSIQYARKNHKWLTQLVNPNTGQLYGNAAKILPMVTSNTSWFQKALNSSQGYASIGTKWSHDHRRLFLTTARINGSNRVVSLGVSIESFIDRFTSIRHRGMRLYLATLEGEMIVQGVHNVKMILTDGPTSVQFFKIKGGQIAHIGNIPCLPTREGLHANASFLNILGIKYVMHCSPLEIQGVRLVYVLLWPHEGSVSFVQKNSGEAIILLILIMTTTVISIFIFVFAITRAAKRETHLCIQLIQQMEATQQAERKSMNKSVAFVSASHDIRASLAGIIGLIELCQDDAVTGSELDTNLKLMDDCTKDLLGILNSILDTSKIEAGKVQLEEEKFHLGQLLEDVVDLYHQAGMKKGVDIVLDPYDGSVIRFSQVKGDRGKLKQVLCNLLSNAVKFTSEGNVTVRAWAKKLPRLQNQMVASNQKNVIVKYLPFLFCKNTQVFGNLQSMNNGVQLNPSAYMEFIIEVDDTGKGIPKDKQKLVFENYVQVKETALGQGGTGLGLGIVQSLVRLMGGDITIVDKKIGEKGTCFRFSVLLTISETMSRDNIKGNNIDPNDDICQRLPTSRPSSQAQSPRLHSPRQFQVSSPKTEASCVVLFIRNDQRRMICQRFFKRLGVKVIAMKHWEDFHNELKKILDKQSNSRHSSRGKSNVSSPCLSESTSCDSGVYETNMDVSLDVVRDAKNYLLPTFKKTNFKGGCSYILIVIDANASPCEKICNTVANFRRGLHVAQCKVVWLLENKKSGIINQKGLESDVIEANDIIFSRPFHGSRLYEVMRLLPEFGGTLFKAGNAPKDPSSTPYQSHSKTDAGKSPISASQISIGVQEETKSSSETSEMNAGPKSRISHVGPQQIQHQEIREEKYGGLTGKKPLSGKKILVAEDNRVLRKIATSTLERLGATTEICENGEEALELVCNGLGNQRKHSASNTLPYDYILMDCEMSPMDGYEATQQIRELERNYNTHIPIIALTAHTTGKEVSRTAQAGMDVHLGKPLREEDLLEAIKHIDSK